MTPPPPPIFADNDNNPCFSGLAILGASFKTSPPHDLPPPPPRHFFFAKKHRDVARSSEPRAASRRSSAIASRLRSRSVLVFARVGEKPCPGVGGFRSSSNHFCDTFAPTAEERLRAEGVPEGCSRILNLFFGVPCTQLFKAEFLTFWFSLFGRFLVEVPEG